MNSILTFFRNTFLNKNDRLLQKMGLETRKGIPTWGATTLANELAYREQRKNVIAVANSFKDSKKKKTNE